MFQKLSVLGAGHVGHACSADLTLSGYKVSLYELPEFEKNLEPIIKRGGIEITGEANVGFAKLDIITTDIEEAIKDTDLIQIAVPAFGHQRMVEECAPHIRNGQTIIFYGCGGGTLLFTKMLRDKSITKKITLGETNLPPYATRRTGPAKVNVYVKYRYLPCAAFPAQKTAILIEKVKKIYPAIAPATNVLETLLGQVNFVAHPAASLLNAGRIEYLGPFRLWREGVTPSVAKVIEAVDEERLQVMKALDLHLLKPYPELGHILGLNPPAKNVREAITKKLIAPINPTDLKKHRYISEDVPYGLVTCASIAEMIQIETPVMNALITIFSAMNEVDYWKEGRTVEKLGISGLSVDALKTFITEGKKP